MSKENSLQKAFQFGATNTEMRVISINNQPWFVANDVCEVLGLRNSRKALSPLDDDEKGVTKVYTVGGKQKSNIINESGLYNLIFRSNKPEAKQFRKWVTSEVLPAIRTTGEYSIEKKLHGVSGLPADGQLWFPYVDAMRAIGGTPRSGASMRKKKQPQEFIKRFGRNFISERYFNLLKGFYDYKNAQQLNLFEV